MLYSLQSATLELDIIIVDLNGTLSVGGKIVDGVPDKIIKLKSLGFTIVLCSGDQRSNARELAKSLEIDFFAASNQEEKSRIWEIYDGEKSIAIGNARIDIGLFEKAKIRILTLQAEGIHTGALSHADILVPSIIDALDLFIDQDRFIATMKV